MTVGHDVDHPIVDVDGHIVESIPLVVDTMRRVAGTDVADRFAASVPSFAARGAELLAGLDAVPDRAPGVFIPPWWSVTADARDRATAFLPSLLHERMDELGLDFTVLYTSVGLACFAHPDDAIRRGACRGLNTYLAEICDGLGDRLTPAAVIPTHTPDEAIAELEHAVEHLGFRAAVCNNVVARTEPDGRAWIDVLALDSRYDYDPLWQRFVDLGVAVTVHSPTMGLPLRQSSSRYMFNHIGTFAAGSDAFAKALVFGGVPARFPTLHFGFLECGVAWAVQLLFDLVARWRKRGGTHIAALDPAGIDRDEWDALVDRYGDDRFADPAVRRSMLAQSDNAPPELDDFRASGAHDAADLVAIFDRFFFGCEADEGTVGWAFAADVNPCGAVLQPVLGSDIGHWDVPDMRAVVAETRELVDDGRLDPAQLRAFTCDNPIRLHGGMNPAFFAGTPVADHARTLLDATKEPSR